MREWHACHICEINILQIENWYACHICDIDILMIREQCLLHL